MKKSKKMILAIIAFIILVAIGNWPGSGTNDSWDNLMKWAKK